MHSVQTLARLTKRGVLDHDTVEREVIGKNETRNK